VCKGTLATFGHLSDPLATRRNALQARTLVAKNDRIQLTTLLNTAEQNVVDQLNTAELTFTNGSVQASTSTDKQSGAAASTLRKDAAKASINRSKEDMGAIVTASISVANAEVAHALRVQTAKVTLAEATGAALKQKHIDQYTQAAIAAAETAIAQATTIFKASEKTSNITRAGDVGDAAIAAANTTGQNLLTQISSQNTALTTYTTTTNTLESTFTSTINGLTVPHTQGTSAAITTADNATANALRSILASTGVADVNWITAFANADATRTGAQAAAQAGWVTSSVQSGSSVLLWNCGDVTSSNASGSWASQYAPARTAMITTTALVDAGRQIAAWLDRTLRDNDQADADVQYIQSIAAPETQLAVAVTQRENQHATSSTNTSNDLNTDLDTSGSNIQSTSAAIEKSSAVDSATAWKAYQVALASLDEGAATTAVDKAYQDALAHVTRNSRVAYANLTYTEGVVQVGSVADAITDMGQAGKTHVTNLADDEKTYTDTAAPIIGARTLLYTEADIDLRKAITTADNVWRNNTAQAWGTHTAGDLVARGNVRRSLANTSNLIADASQASIAELKAQWWQNEIPNYLQWSVDIGGIETTYTNSTTANILLRTTGVKNAGITYASTVGTAIKAYETTTATARELYLSTLMTISETAAEATMRAERDKEIALADADLQKQLTGNESAHTTAVNNANSAHSTATADAEAARKSAEQAALTQLNSTLAQATKDKEASIAGAERTYDQAVASLDAQYGSASSNGDTGVEGATRRSAIKTRDAQYYAARDTSWANTLSGSTTLGTSPWTVKAITAANAEAAHSVSRANAQAAHDAAMLDAIEDWKLSRNESLTDLLLTEGQSRETYNVATSNVYANWENGVGNLLGDKPAGTGYVPVRGFGESGVGTLGGKGSGKSTGSFFADETEPTTGGNKEPNGPVLPNPSEETSSTKLNNAIEEYESLIEEGVQGLYRRAISPKEMEELLQGLEGVEIYRTEEFIVVKANGASFVFERRFQPSRSEPRPYWVLIEILQTEGFSNEAIVQHAKNDRSISGLEGNEKVLEFALHLLPTGTLWDKVWNKTDENVYYVALMTAGDLTLVGGLYFKATTRIGKAVLITDVAVNGVGAGAAAYQYANSEEGRAAHAGEFILRLAAMGLGANSLRLSNAQAKLANASPKAQSLETVADNAPPLEKVADIAPQGSSSDLIAQPRPGSISGNPANRKIETGIPRKDGAWKKKWVRITEEDLREQRTAIANRYNELLNEASELNLMGQARTDFLFEQMRQFRTTWLKNFLDNRKY
jgi:hypothetical protein